MTELAAGAVSSLLLVVRNEQLLLGGVKDDVQFIKEEMESMKSFLAHLARSTPPGGEHDEQVRTWMTQVRLLAQDCHNCIDLYLYSGNPHIHRAKSRLRRYLWWVYWFLRKLLAQHRAAVQLRQLKDRARDVGERRLRYGVEVPTKAKSAAGQSSPAATGLMAVVAGGYATKDDEEDGDDDDRSMLATTDHSSQKALFSRTLDDYVKAKIREWINNMLALAAADAVGNETVSFVIGAPEDRYRDVITLVREASVFRPGFEYRSGYHLAVLIDIPALHLEFLPLRPKEVLFYILRQIKLKLCQGREQGEGEVGSDFRQLYSQKFRIYGEKKTLLHEIKCCIEKMKIYEKLENIKSALQNQPPKSQQEDMDQKDPDLHVLLKQLIWSSLPASQQDQLMKDKDMSNKLSASDNTIILVAEKLQEHMQAIEQVEEGEVGGEVQNGEVEEDREGGKQMADVSRGGEIVEEGGGGRGGGEERKIYLHLDQYVHILRQVFPKSSSNNDNKSPAMQATNTIFGEDQIKQMIDVSKQEILRELQGGKDEKKQDQTGQNTEAIFKEIVEKKMDKIKHEFKEQMKIKGLLDDIECQLQKKYPLFILRIDETVDLPRWEDIRNALNLLEPSGDVLFLTTAKDIQQAKKYCYPQSEPIDYSLVGFYHVTVLEITKQQKNEKNYDPQIYRNILEQCESNEFCMKIFTHALYVNPKRSNEELNKLHKNLLQASPKSSSDIIAKKMFMFSYTDMPKEYKSCLQYLAIFPLGHKIRRSTLIGRWVAEGLIFKEDWLSSVQWANRCFDELISRGLVDPAETGAAGKVKSCVVSDLVHGFITKMARKQHILETRLSHHLARHFSIFNDLQLRSSDKIDGFFQRLSKSSRVETRLLKVLDLEGCKCFGGKNQRYLEDICSNMLLLKYLSLRGTDVTQLPSKINNLRELEVLDIRQTKVPPHATENILLLKLKRLLASHIELNNGYGGQIPHRIGKMVNMEVLSNVKAQCSRDLKDIGKLWQLRKLGVVIDDKDSHLEKLLQTISDLHESLCSLSITTSIPPRKALGTNPSPASADDGIGPLLTNHPKILHSLSIRGTTHKGSLLSLFTKGNKNILSKVTLSDTLLSEDDLKLLAGLPMLQCLRLQCIACTDTDMLTFEEDEFKRLKYLLVEGSGLTNITFRYRSAPELEKMVLSFTSTGSVSGVQWLPKLEELELNNSSSGRLLSSFDNAKKIAKLTLRGTELEQKDIQILAKKPNIRSLVLLERSFGGRQDRTITFRKDEFLWINLLVVNCSATSKIVFNSGSAPRLEKIVWSSPTGLYGIDKLPRLKELEFNGEQVPDVVKEASENHKNKPILIHIN